MDTNLPALIAALGASVGVAAHGVIGHRWLVEQLDSVQMQPSRFSTRLFGPGDVTATVFGVTWHVVTAVFLVTAGALFLTGFGALESRDLLRFIAALYASFLAVGAFYAAIYSGGRLGSMLQPIPVTFFACMVAAAAGAWIASSSV